MDGQNREIHNSIQEKHSRKTLAGFASLHFLNDMHTTDLPALIPMLVQSLSMTMSQAGALNAVFGLTNIIAQPITGYFADRQRRPWFAVWGPLLSTACICLLPLSPTYAIAFALVILASTGTSLFHPQGTGRAGRSAGSKNLAFYISLFSASGSLGSAIGPVYIVFMISLLGKKLLPVMIIPMAFICFYMWRHLSIVPAKDVIHSAGGFSDFFRSIREVFSKVWNIVIVTGVRDAVYQGIKVFLPMLIVLRGGSISMGGAALFAVTMSGTLAGIAGGKLSEKFGDEPVLIASITAAPVFLFSGLVVPGIAGLCLLLIGYAFIGGSTPITTSMAQKRCTGARSTASSFSMGVSWGLANLATSPIGVAADAIGLETTLRIVALVPWLITACYAWKHYSAARAKA